MFNSTNPSFKLNTAKSFSKGLAWCVTPIAPQSGGGFFSPQQAVIHQGGSSAPTVWAPTFINYRGSSILGQKFTTGFVSMVQFDTSQTVPPPIVTSTGNYQGDYTILMLGNPPAEGAYRRYITQGLGGSVAPGWCGIMGNFNGNTLGVVSGMMTMFDFNGSATVGYANAASAQDGNTHCFICRRKNGIYTINRDGIDITSAQSGASTQVISNSVSSFAVGGMTSTNENNCANCTIGLAAGWNRALSDAETNSLGLYPFSMFMDYSSLNRFIFQK